ncbi:MULTISPECIES: carbohydrate ABC transporter permease [unclassified Mesorhizobium]|jgi:multiple sugar transport system permease protein|uniref:carbohydrate ABC transporter permease n=1 Tax=unclassified Mesorhizobium TaxID=325217 RepID=UPI00086DFA1B|nr:MULTISPECIES: carbohydrate ABC transporter permease [unclassified Mesorhizobium]MBN9258087.1 carbohydrate ABC transporter permease [Mesorhizobium sp.]MBN9274824.1 carbohydrate ABC transporter permease [Mesorhizobium sp.]ODT18781.1 MAG: ABC transporter permease [Mesorhizobium sp. SCN 65-12]OJX71605.1 MAG: ABC transporter permease [Mesorhizobium sp. 65-26]
MKRSWRQASALYGGLAALALIIGLPFWWVVTGSIKLPREIIQREPTMIPHSFTLQHFEKLLQASDFPVYLLNSVIVAVFSTAFTVLLALPAAYAFFRMEFPGRNTLYRTILLAYAFPGVVVLIPLYGLFAKVGLIDSPVALVIVNVALALPFSIWMMRSFLATVPREIEEAAVVDGAPTTTILLRILMPLIAPGIASVAIFAFISSWTEYLFASVLIVSDARRTIPVGFAGIIGQYQIDWGLLLAGATAAIVPVVALFAFIGRWFVSGLTEGAVK